MTRPSLRKAVCIYNQKRDQNRNRDWDRNRYRSRSGNRNRSGSGIDNRCGNRSLTYCVMKKFLQGLGATSLGFGSDDEGCSPERGINGRGGSPNPSPTPPLPTTPQLGVRMRINVHRLLCMYLCVYMCVCVCVSECVYVLKAILSYKIRANNLRIGLF